MKRVALVAAALVIWAGCADLAIEPETTYLHADVEGAFSLEHRGEAHLDRGTMPGTMHRARYLESNVWRSSMELETALRFQLLSEELLPWEAGTYPLDPRNFMSGDYEGTTAHFQRGPEWFVSESGTLTITEVVDRRVFGHFELTAVFWCNRALEPETCESLPASYAAESPRLEIRGSFEAEIPGTPVVPRLPGGGG
jgi:hypothetical protein